MNNINHLVLSWSVSRGRDTYGYNICRLDDRNNGKRYRCSGGGYDMVGTVLADWLCDVYQAELLAIRERASYYYSKAKGMESRDSQDASLYGAVYYVDENRVSIDGACGVDTVLRICKEIGLEMERDYISKGRRRGETIGWYVSKVN